MGSANKKIKFIDFFSGEVNLELDLRSGWARHIIYASYSSVLCASCWHKTFEGWKIIRKKDYDYEYIFNKIIKIKSLLGNSGFFYLYDGKLFYDKT